MSCAVELEGILVMSTLIAREGDIGGAHIGAVKDDDLVVVEDLHVHGGDAYAWSKENPLSTQKRLENIKI